MVDDIRHGIDRERITLLAAIDFSRAFDLVNIPLLVKKLEALDFSDPACSWIRSFLSDRSQVVADALGNLSTALKRKAGVPQGSLLGPLLFALYINDVPSVLRHCRHHFYADDLTLYIHGKFAERADLVAKLNEDLKNLTRWAADNGLLINPSKTQVIWFGSRRFITWLGSMVVPKVRLGGLELDYSDTVKLLGVTLDCTLSWRPQCLATSRKSFAALSRLRKCSDSLPMSTRLMLVKALVFPYFDYCAGVLLSLSAELVLKLQRCKNAAIRFATGLKRHEHITGVYERLHVMPFTVRRDYLSVCTLASVLRTKEPQYLYKHCHFRPVGGAGPRRQSPLDLVPSWARTDYYKRSFRIHAVNLWNSIPDNIRSCFHQPCFKTNLEKHMLRTHFNRS